MRTRYLQKVIQDTSFANHKMAFVSGPRQCGKTTMARLMLRRRPVSVYHNWDDVTFRREWVKDPKRTVPEAVPSNTRMVVYDEIHKARQWKGSLKGIYDTLNDPADILVTGSVRLNAYRRGSDSLVGRYYHYRLHPFSLTEMRSAKTVTPDAAIDVLMHRGRRPSKSAQNDLLSLMKYGPFPEPLFAQDTRLARLWRRTRLERVIREDLRDLSRIPELGQVEMLAALLPERVGSPVSVATLRDLLEVAHPTATRWLSYLRELYYIFELKPYSRSVSRSLKKEGKIYLWDPGEVQDRSGRFENLVALHLLRACHLWTDSGEGDFALWYLRNKDRQEIDFLITRDGTPWLPVEVKMTETTPSPNWRRFLPQLPCRLGIQVCLQAGVWRVLEEGSRTVIVASASEVLRCLP